MEHWTKDKRGLFIAASIILNIIVIYLVSFGSFAGWGSKSMQIVYFVAGMCLLVLGELDVLRNYERRDDRFELATVRWLIAAAFLCAVMDYYSAAVYAFFSNILMWWVMLVLVIRVMYSGYYAPIKKWVAAFPVVMCAITNFFLGYISEITGLILTEILIIVPLGLLIVINIKYFKQLHGKWQRKMALCYICFAVAMIITEFIFVVLNVTGQKNHIGPTYDSIFSILLILYTFLISFNIAMKEGILIKNYKYTAVMASALAVAAGLLGAMLNSIKGIAIGILISMSLILVQELAMMLFKSGEASEKHKNIMEKHTYVIAQRKKMAGFLHDEILQDLYAIKLLLEASGNEKETKEAVNLLTKRVRLEMEQYSVRLEKSISYKDNLKAMLDTVKKRYPQNSIETELFCDDNLHLSNPIDEIIYVIIRELVTNVYKHSNGDLCHVLLRKKDGMLFLEVEDNGVMNKNHKTEEYTSGHGLRKIKELLEVCDSKISFEKSRSGGAKVKITILTVK